MLILLFRICSMPVVLLCRKGLLFLSGMQAGGGQPCLPREGSLLPDLTKKDADYRVFDILRFSL
jgi:hypothetical protein